jgi:protein gp37
MSATHTAISWTDRTWNPLRGCRLVSPGCTHCYAMRQAGRFSAPGQPYEGLVRKTSQGYTWTGKVRLIERDLAAPLRWKTPQRVFVNSMSDLFHEAVPEAWLDAIFTIMAGAPHHTFQILTKRPERMQAYCSQRPLLGRLQACRLRAGLGGDPLHVWPLPNVWLGVSVETKATLPRLNALCATPATLRFASFEPLLEDLGDITPWLAPVLEFPALDWCIIGGESGPKARPCNLEWARHLIRQCQGANVPVWMKQVGARPCIDMTGGNRYDAHTCFPVRDTAGADPAAWPAHLRVQQFPEVRVCPSPATITER